VNNIHVPFRSLRFRQPFTCSYACELPSPRLTSAPIFTLVHTTTTAAGGLFLQAPLPHTLASARRFTILFPRGAFLHRASCLWHETLPLRCGPAGLALPRRLPPTPPSPVPYLTWPVPPQQCGATTTTSLPSAVGGSLAPGAPKTPHRAPAILLLSNIQCYGRAAQVDVANSSFWFAYLRAAALDNVSPSPYALAPVARVSCLTPCMARNVPPLPASPRLSLLYPIAIRQPDVNGRRTQRRVAT